jgi:hypothetical protein
MPSQPPDQKQTAIRHTMVPVVFEHTPQTVRRVFVHVPQCLLHDPRAIPALRDDAVENLTNRGVLLRERPNSKFRISNGVVAHETRGLRIQCPVQGAQQFEAGVLQGYLFLDCKLRDAHVQQVLATPWLAVVGYHHDSILSEPAVALPMRDGVEQCAHCRVSGVQSDPAAEGGCIDVLDADGNLLLLPELQEGVDHVRFTDIERSDRTL